MTDWDESEHPRDDQGRFARKDAWAARISAQIDPESQRLYEQAQRRHQEHLLAVFDTIQGVLKHKDDPHWMAHHQSSLRMHLEQPPPEFARDPGLMQAQRALTKSYSDRITLPWTGITTKEIEERAEEAYPFWRAEIARELRRRGYDLDRVEAFLNGTAYPTMMDLEDYLGTSPRTHSFPMFVNHPTVHAQGLIRNLENLRSGQVGLAVRAGGNRTGIGVDQMHLRTADHQYDAAMEGERGGKQIKAWDLDRYPEYATSGDYEIWLDGAWHQLEEVYRDNPDEEEIELIAGDQHRMVDTSDDVELRRVATPRRRAWWE